MAGLGFKDFQVGEVLTSSDVDGYLMQQTVMRFADAAARGSALGTATGTAVPLAEGMVAYLDDANRAEFYSGSAWTSISKIVQVVSAVKTASQSGSGTTWVDITDLSVTITPVSSSSTVLVYCSIGALGAAHQNSAVVRVLRDSTVLSVGDADGSRIRGVTGVRQGESAFIVGAGGSVMLLDTPATTSATTYKAQASGSSSWAVNRAVSSTDSSTYPLGVSTIVAMEVAG